MSVPDNEIKTDTGRGALEQIVERLREAAHFCTDIIELEKHCNAAANDLDALIASVGVSVTVGEAKLPNGDTAGCGAETNSPAALVGTKKVYIKPLRTIVEVQAAYADQIRDWLNAAPVDAGVREALKPLMTIVNNIAWCHDIDGLRKARDQVNALLASSQPVLDREKWEPIETAPRDGTPILGWCDHEADPYIEDEKSGRLTTYGAHAEGLSHVEDGPHVLVWGGGFDDRSYDEPNGANMPDWWFLTGNEFEVAANPTHWKPIDAPADAIIASLTSGGGK